MPQFRLKSHAFGAFLAEAKLGTGIFLFESAVTH
jgi:hypothetical protein